MWHPANVGWKSSLQSTCSLFGITPQCLNTLSNSSNPCSLLSISEILNATPAYSDDINNFKFEIPHAKFKHRLLLHSPEQMGTSIVSTNMFNSCFSFRVSGPTIVWLYMEWCHVKKHASNQWEVHQEYQNCYHQTKFLQWIIMHMMRLLL